MWIITICGAAHGIMAHGMVTPIGTDTIGITAHGIGVGDTIAGIGTGDGVAPTTGGDITTTTIIHTTLIIRITPTIHTMLAATEVHMVDG